MLHLGFRVLQRHSTPGRLSLADSTQEARQFTRPTRSARSFWLGYVQAPSGGLLLQRHSTLRRLSLADSTREASQSPECGMALQQEPPSWSAAQPYNVMPFMADC